MNKFSVDLSRIVAKTKDKLDIVVQKFTYELFANIVLKTPVDTGRARGNWQCAINSYASGTLDLTDKSGGAAISTMARTVLSTKAGYLVSMVNNLPYIGQLEYGSSKQAPGGMVRLTVNGHQQYLNKAVKGLA